MAFITRNRGDESIFLATGDSGNGMTHGTIARMLITDPIVGREIPWARLLSEPAISDLSELRGSQR